MVEPVRPIALSDIEAARERIAGTILRTPLVKLDLPGEADIYLKLENLQPTNAYKIRGAANAVASLSEEERGRGVWTVSAGNAGQGVAYLDDGTMIVVDNARRCIGRNVDVIVTSVLQTTAGRMIFTRLKEEAEREEYQVARG